MNVVILKTNLQNADMVGSLEPILNHHDKVVNWSVDLEDVDRVLRIETTTRMEEVYFRSLLSEQGLEVDLMADK